MKGFTSTIVYVPEHLRSLLHNVLYGLQPPDSGKITCEQVADTSCFRIEFDTEQVFDDCTDTEADLALLFGLATAAQFPVETF